MPWETPTLAEVRRLSRDYVSAYLPGADATVPNSVLRVLSDNNAALGYQALLYLDWLALQLLPDTAETEWLDRHAHIWLGGRKAATYADGTITFTGTAGTGVPVGTRVQATTGALFETIEQVVLSGEPTNALVSAITDGSTGNVEVGALLSVVDARSGLDGTATAGLLSGGAEVENDDDLRDRVLFRIRRPPMGGSNDDYVRWALAVPGVTRAWNAAREMGIGTTTVRFMMDAERASSDPSVDGFPLPEDVAEVTAYIDTVRPVAVKDFWVEAPLPQPISFTVSSLTVDTTAVRLAINESVRAMLEDRATPGQTIWRSWVVEAVSVAAGEDHHENSFVTTPMPSLGHLAVFGTITFA